MTRFVVCPRLGPTDVTPIVAGVDEKLVEVDFLNKAGALRHGIGRAIRDMSRLKLHPTAMGLDLLILAVLVYAADTRVSRVQTSQDGWTREFRLVVPVSDPVKWDRRKDLLSQTLRFLTGDLWEIAFRTWPSKVKAPLINRPELGFVAPFDSVSLFSGGMDSLIGAIDTLESGEKTLFVSHGGDGSVSSPQEKLFSTLVKEYEKCEVKRVRMGLRVNADLVPGVRGENTTRGRSFLFFALGAFVGTSLNKAFQLRVPENGFISLNVPLDGTRLGSNSTRTTHPFYIHRWNELLSAIGISCTIVNPYWEKTKGEMMRDCASKKTLAILAPNSVSCSHPAYKRYAKDDNNHCGTCLPCIIRRAAFSASPLKDATGYRLDDLSAATLDSTRSEGIQIRAVQYAIDRLAKNPKLAEVLIYKPGPLIEDIDKLSAYAGMYRRGMAELKKIVQHATTKPT
jgi:hypothetical protein